MPTRSPVRPRLTTKGAATRRRIIAGAAAVIRERGAAAVTLDDICAVTSTSKGQLFHYFPAGREELLLAVAEHESEQVLTDQEPHLSRLADWADWYAWRDAVVARYERHGPDCPLGVLLTELGRRSPGGMAVTCRLLERWQEALRAGIVRMQERGHVDPAIDPVRTAGALVAAVQGGVTILMSTGSIAQLEAALDTALLFLGAPRDASPR